MIVWLKKRRFNKLIQEYLDGLLQLAYMRCANKELAEDLVQEACIKAYKSYIDKEEIANPKAWLFRILINTHIDHVRKKQLEIADLDNFEFVDKRNPSQDTESNYFFKDLNYALKQLEPEQRVVAYLADVNEYSYKEIAELLEVPLGTVMSRLHRARQTLRKILASKGYAKEGTRTGELK